MKRLVLLFTIVAISVLLVLVMKSFIVSSEYDAAQLLLEVQMAVRQGSYSAEMVSQLERASEKDPSNREIKLWLGFLYRMIGQPSLAVHILQEALHPSQAPIEDELKGQLLLNLGTALFALGDTMGAFQTFAGMLPLRAPWPDRAIERASSSLRVYFPSEDEWSKEDVRQFVVGVNLLSRDLHQVVLLTLTDHLTSPFNLYLHALSANAVGKPNQAKADIAQALSSTSDLTAPLLLFPQLAEMVDLFPDPIEVALIASDLGL